MTIALKRVYDPVAPEDVADAVAVQIRIVRRLGGGQGIQQNRYGFRFTRGNLYLKALDLIVRGGELHQAESTSERRQVEPVEPHCSVKNIDLDSTFRWSTRRAMY